MKFLALCLVVSCIGVSQAEQILGFDPDNFTISCKYCKDVTDKLFGIATNETRLVKGKDVMIDLVCLNDPLNSFPGITKKCSEYVGSLYNSVMKAVVFSRKNYKFCSEIAQCGKKFELEQSRGKLITLAVQVIQALTTENIELSSIFTSVLTDRQLALTTFIEKVCEARVNTQDTTPAGKRIDRICRNAVSQPLCSVCETASGIAANYTDSIKNILVTRLSSYCTDSKCKEFFDAVFTYGFKVLQTALRSDLICHTANACTKPKVFQICDPLPFVAQEACHFYVLTNYKKYLTLAVENRLENTTLEKGCELCKKTSDNVLGILDEEGAAYKKVIQSFCNGFEKAPDACTYLLNEKYDKFLQQLKNSMESYSLCPKLKLCKASETPSKVEAGYFCKACSTVRTFLHTQLKDDLLKVAVEKRLFGFCNNYSVFKVTCNYLADKYFSVFYDRIVSEIDSLNVCWINPECILV